MSILHIPFYPSKWLSGTRGLSDAETGIYITLIARMYEMAGPIERDDERLWRLCGSKSKASFRKALEYLISEGKITVINGELFNDRVEKVIKNVTEKSSKAKDAAQARWDKKSNKINGGCDADAMQTHSERICQRKRKLNVEKDVPNGTSKKLPSEPVGFDEFWQAYPHKVGKGDARKAFAKAIKRTSIDNLMAGLDRYASKTDDRPWCNPSTWLNQDRWDDEPATPVGGPVTDIQRIYHATEGMISHEQSPSADSESGHQNVLEWPLRSERPA